MSKITIDNYEAFLLDFSEGKLDAQTLRELDAFFALHPELDQRAELAGLPNLPMFTESFIQKEELLKSDFYFEDEEMLNYLEGICSADELIRFEKQLQNNEGLRQQLAVYKSTRLKPEPVVFERTALYKNEDDVLLKDPAISYVEGCLSGAELEAFEKQVEGSVALKKELLLLSKTKLAADLFIVFENKQTLKKQAKVIALFSWKSVARVAALLLLVFSILLPFYLNNKDTKEVAVVTPPLQEAKPQSTPQKEGGSNDEVKTNENVQPEKEQINVQPVAKATTATHQPATNREPLIETAHQEREAVKQEPIEPSNDKQTLIDEKLLADAEPVTPKQEVRDSSQSLELFASVDELKFTEEIEEIEINKEQKGFWKKAVGFAKQANKLGVKSIEGEENTNVKFRLSFNSFSVEKR